MTWRGRRGGIFERLPRAIYRRSGARRYVDVTVALIPVNGVVVAGFAVATIALYVELSAGELAAFAACTAAAYALEGAVAAGHARRAAAPARAWLAGERGEDATVEAWCAAARLPVELLRRPSVYAVGVVAVAAADLALVALLDLPAHEAALLVPASHLLYASSVVLRYVALDLGMRPLLATLGERLREAPPFEVARVSLHRRLLVTVPMVTWGAAVVVAGLLTEGARDFDMLARASLAAVAVTAALSVWLSVVLADVVSGPIVDLRDATRRVGAGDLDVRVPVVSTDETGELSESFNAMVAGLGERERLHDAFGAFVDPALTERVLAEGTDLRGEEVEVSVVFVDVRDFTAFAERAAPHEVVATLNELYEAIVPVVVRHGGHANKFVGDGLLAVFGAPERHPDHARRAVAAAREVAARVRDRLGARLRVGVGVNTGRVVVGTVGGGGRRDFTVIGDPVNTAARVEAATRLTGDDVLVTEATLRALGDAGGDFEERPSAPLRGKAETVRLYAPRAGR